MQPTPIAQHAIRPYKTENACYGKLLHKAANSQRRKAAKKMSYLQRNTNVFFWGEMRQKLE